MSNSTDPKLAEPIPGSTPVVNTPPQSDNVAHALAGAGGGILSTALTYPLITLSTRAQVESKREKMSTLAAARKIMAKEGVSGLYAGIDSALFGISLTNFVYYYWYEWTRAFFESAALKSGRATKKLTTAETMMAGAVAGSLTVLITNPIWVVNTRMTTMSSSSKSSEKEPILPTSSKLAPEPQKKPSTIGVAMQILKDDGLMGFFAGVMPALVLVINPILQYTVFEQLKSALEKRRRVTPTDSFYLGALGKLAATSITYPYITVKSRMHVAKAKDGQTKKEGMGATLSRIVNEEGVTGLYGGIGPKVTQSVLTAAFLFAFKDALYDVSVKLRKSMSAN